jgi:hypothetical protein
MIPGPVLERPLCVAQNGRSLNQNIARAERRSTANSWRLIRYIALPLASTTILILSCAPSLEELAPFPCADDGTCPEPLLCASEMICLVSEPCNIHKDDCPRGSKCAVIFTSETDRAFQCVPEEGDGTDGDECSREYQGADDCAPGFYCSPIGVLSCRRMCFGENDCTVDTACSLFGYDPDVGVCLPRCLLTTDCGEGKSCKLVGSPDRGAGICATDGPQPEGATCDGDRLCGPNLFCAGTCVRNCDASVGCGLSGHCVLFGDLGACVCNPFEECGPGRSCKLNGSDDKGYSGLCAADGPGQAGAPCEENTDCDSSLICYGKSDLGYQCTRLCDNAHTCNGSLCLQVNDFEKDDMDNGGGICKWF